MKKFALIFTIATVLMQLPNAYADEPVRVSSNGDIVDKSGNVIAVPNPDDPRNDDYNKYYTSLDASGHSTGGSSFYIVSDPNQGYVKKEISTNTAPSEPSHQVPDGMDFTPFANVASPDTTQTAEVTTTTSSNGTTSTRIGAATFINRPASMTNSTSAPTPSTVNTTAAKSRPQMIDAPNSDGSSDSVYGNVTEVQTLYDGH